MSHAFQALYPCLLINLLWHCLYVVLNCLTCTFLHMIAIVFASTSYTSDQCLLAMLKSSEEALYCFIPNQCMADIRYYSALFLIFSESWLIDLLSTLTHLLLTLSLLFLQGSTHPPACPPAPATTACPKR